MSPKLARLNFPKPGMGIEEGTVARWLKAEGDSVQEGEVLVEMETAKAIQEIQAPVSGILREILVAAGETVPINSTLAMIESRDEPRRPDPPHI
jgi:pyruvate/2-oxoglutarate dehydrogenase complex dihydrolipoamide acyltransferase (E2) component